MLSVFLDKETGLQKECRQHSGTNQIDYSKMLEAFGNKCNGL